MSWSKPQGTSFEMDSLHLLDAFSDPRPGDERAQSIDTEKIVAYIDSGTTASFDTIYGPGSWGSHPEVYGNNHCGKQADAHVRPTRTARSHSSSSV